MSSATLYVVATPIGNLDDISPRALEVLGAVDRVAAEDTRHSGRLLAHFGIRARLVAYHDHNERQRLAGLVSALQAGESVALVSDAGTPLVSDPGYHLVRAALEAGIRVSPVPGPSAMIAALSVAGLPSDRFCFEGFLPAQGGKRRRRLEGLVGEPRTLVFYESSHRIRAFLDDLVAVFSPEREATLSRELTKRFETVRRGSVAELAEWLDHDPVQQKGEFVVVVRGAENPPAGESVDAGRLLENLLPHVKPGVAAEIAARTLGGKKRDYYALGLALKDRRDSR